MTIEVNIWYLYETTAPWEYLSHGRRPEGYEFDPQDNEFIAGLVCRDLVPWIQQWPPLLLKRLGDALEFFLQYDDENELTQSDFEGFSWLQIDHMREAVWEPMFAELFGELVPRPRDAYKLLRGKDQQTALSADCGDYRFLDHMPDWLPPDR